MNKRALRILTTKLWLPHCCMCEISTMCPIGAFTGKLFWHFWDNFNILALKSKERILRRVCRRIAHVLACLLEFSRNNRGSDWLWLEGQFQRPLTMGKMLWLEAQSQRPLTMRKMHTISKQKHQFVHIVPLSRALPPTPNKKLPNLRLPWLPMKTRLKGGNAGFEGSKRDTRKGDRAKHPEKPYFLTMPEETLNF